MSYFGKQPVCGRSGREYVFDCFDLDTEFADVGAIYIFARYALGLLAPSPSMDLLYVGKASELRSRLSYHEKWTPALQMGANRLLTLKVGLLTDRSAVERDIIEFNCPPLNDAMNPMARYLGGHGVAPRKASGNALADIVASLSDSSTVRSSNALADIAEAMRPRQALGLNDVGFSPRKNGP